MLFRRNIALAVGALVLATPALTSCGFNYATDRVNNLAAGVNNRDASVDVLGAVIVSSTDGSGTFIASLANNDQEKVATLDSIEASDQSMPLTVGSFSPIKVRPGSLVNLAVKGGVPVSGEFKAGDFVPVSIGLSTGERVEMKVPVVTDDDIYAGLDTSSSTSSTPSGETQSESPSASPTE